MLGKTNITALQEGAIVDDIADFRWLEQQAGVNGNFVQAVFKNNYLIGITANGNIVYSTDGDSWEISIPEYNDIKLNDVEWDGARFLISGSYKEDDAEKALLLSTTDFSSYEKIDIDSLIGSLKITELIYVYPENGKYILAAIDHYDDGLKRTTLYKLYGDMKSEFTYSKVKYETGNYSISFAKNSSKQIISLCFELYEYNYALTSNSVYDVGGFYHNSSGYSFVGMGKAFECKDFLYFFSNHYKSNNNLTKYVDESNKSIVSTGINWSFTDAVYFNECEIFINDHNMLIVRKGEKIGDKTLDDMVEIVAEKSISCIEKAFGRLYVFGNQGVILKSTNEVNNEEGILVQQLSAKQALAESKRYTDEKIAALEARVAALEAK